MKSITEVSAAILAMKRKRKVQTARKIIEDRADAKLAASGEQVGSGVFSCEPPQKLRTNYKKGKCHHAVVTTNGWV